MTDICQFVLDWENLPDHGGSRPQVVVTVRLEDLQKQIGTAAFDDGTLMSATQARRFACDAGLIPAVLGGQGQVLDVGRERRRFTGVLRRALNLRDGGCAFPGCDRPARWAEGHHTVAWQDNGKTSLDTGVLLCRAHRRVIHDTPWEVQINPIDGLPEFLPPSFMDIDRKPRRNPYHKRR